MAERGKYLRRRKRFQLLERYFDTQKRAISQECEKLHYALLESGHQIQEKETLSNTFRCIAQKTCREILGSRGSSKDVIRDQYAFAIGSFWGAELLGEETNSLQRERGIFLRKIQNLSVKLKFNQKRREYCSGVKREVSQRLAFATEVLESEDLCAIRRGV